MHKKNKHTYSHRKKKASPHRTAAFLTAVVMILAALVCGAAIYIHHLNGRPKTVIHALNNENESNGPTQKLNSPQNLTVYNQPGLTLAPRRQSQKSQIQKKQQGFKNQKKRYQMTARINRRARSSISLSTMVLAAQRRSFLTFWMSVMSKLLFCHSTVYE